MSYNRVIPRDLFNEAKLLKCLGQLALIIHDEVRVPRGLSFDHEEPQDGFKVDQSPSSGALYCENLNLFYRGRVIDLITPYNSKDSYPLQFACGEQTEGSVFDETGALSDEFLDALKTLD